MRTTPTGWSCTGGADLFCGTGATPAERSLAYGMATLVTAIVLVVDLYRITPIAEGWRIALLAFFAFDIGGGAVANMLNSSKRFYHSGPKLGESGAVRLAKNSTAFAAIHVHPIVAALAFDGSVFNGVVWYILLQAGVAVTLAIPLYMQRAGASAIALLALFGSLYLLPLGAGLEWFIPCIFIKIVLGHTVRELPYGPKQA